MSAITMLNPFVFCAALLGLSFLAIFVLWFIERSRGLSAPQIAALTAKLAPRPLT